MLKDIAVGGWKMAGSSFDLPPNAGAVDMIELYRGRNDNPVAADDRRRLLVREDFAREHWTTTGFPRGHGFNNGGGDATWYAIPSSDTDVVQFVTLDTVRAVDGRLFVFGTNGDGQVFQRYQSRPGSWDASRWSQIDGTMTQLAATMLPVGGSIELFGINPDGLVYYRTQNILNPTAWTDWVQMDGLLRPDIPHSGRNAMAGGPPQPPIPISVVPDVVGRKQANAEAALQAAGLAVGSVTSVTVFDSSDGGKVMTQSLNPGLNVPAGTTVNLMIGQWSGRNR